MRFAESGLFMFAAVFLCFQITRAAPGDWTQAKYDARRSGNAPEREVEPPLGLVGAAALTDAVMTSPVVAKGRVYAVDGSAAAFRLPLCTGRKRRKVPPERLSGLSGPPAERAVRSVAHRLPFACCAGAVDRRGPGATMALDGF